MKKKVRIANMPMTDEQKVMAIQKLNKSIKYNMFTTLDDEDSIDDRIMCLSDIEFEQLKSVFKSRIGFFDAIGEAERYVIKGQDVPAELWQGIVMTRKAYEQTFSKYKRRSSNA